MKTDHWIEDLKFSVEVFDEGDNLLEVLACMTLARRARPTPEASCFFGHAIDSSRGKAAQSSQQIFSC